MKKAELRVRNTGKLYDDGVTPLLNDNDGFEELVEEGKENKWNMMFPLITLIGGAFIGLLVTGGSDFHAEGDKHADFGAMCAYWPAMHADVQRLLDTIETLKGN